MSDNRKEVFKIMAIIIAAWVAYLALFIGLMFNMGRIGHFFSTHPEIGEFLMEMLKMGWPLPVFIISLMFTIIFIIVGSTIVMTIRGKKKAIAQFNSKWQELYGLVNGSVFSSPETEKNYAALRNWFFYNFSKINYDFRQFIRSKGRDPDPIIEGMSYYYTANSLKELAQFKSNDLFKEKIRAVDPYLVMEFCGPR